MNTASNKGKVFYGWYVVAGALLIMFMIGGIAWNCVSVFIKPVCADLGFTRQAMSMNTTITSIIGMCISLSWGYILKHFSLKKLMRLAAFGLPLGYVGYSFCSEIWMFYACSVLVGLSLCLVMNLPLSIIISNWFEEKRGQAMGIAFMGSGIGGMLFIPVISNMIEKMGWRFTYRFSAAVMFAAAFVAIFFLIRLRPEEMGLKPLGWEKRAAAAAETGAVPAAEGPLFSELSRTGRFWLLAFCISASNSAVGCVNQALQPHLTDNGYPVATAALIVSIGMGLLAVGKMGLGVVFDKMGIRIGTLFSLGLGLLGLIGMIFCRSWLGVAAAVVLGQGIGCAFGTVGVPIVTRALFGERDYATNYGVVCAIGGVCNSISPMLNGAAYDRFGSYNPALVLWACLMAFGLLVFVRTLPGRKKA